MAEQTTKFYEEDDLLKEGEQPCLIERMNSQSFG